MPRPVRTVVATIHQELVEQQRREIDDYMEEFGVYTRTAVVDEALAEFMAKRKRTWPRTYGQVSGPRADNGFNRRATDRETA